MKTNQSDSKQKQIKNSKSKQKKAQKITNKQPRPQNPYKLIKEVK